MPPREGPRAPPLGRGLSANVHDDHDDDDDDDDDDVVMDENARPVTPPLRGQGGGACVRRAMREVLRRSNLTSRARALSRASSSRRLTPARPPPTT